MKDEFTTTVVDALARYEVHRRWPSLKPERIEENVAIMRSDTEIVRSARVAMEALAALSGNNAETTARRDTWRRAGVEAAVRYVRSKADRYVVYGLTTSSIERHAEEMGTALTPRGAAERHPPLVMVRRALAKDAVAVGWPSLREDLVDLNVSMMENDARIVRHAEIVVSIVDALRHDADPEAAVQDNRDLLEFQRGVEAASRYFVTLSAREWRPRTIGWGLKAIADDVKQRVMPN